MNIEQYREMPEVSIRQITNPTEDEQSDTNIDPPPYFPFNKTSGLVDTLLDPIYGADSKRTLGFTLKDPTSENSLICKASGLSQDTYDSLFSKLFVAEAERDAVQVAGEYVDIMERMMVDYIKVRDHEEIIDTSLSYRRPEEVSTG